MGYVGDVDENKKTIIISHNSVFTDVDSNCSDKKTGIGTGDIVGVGGVNTFLFLLFRPFISDTDKAVLVITVKNYYFRIDIFISL